MGRRPERAAEPAVTRVPSPARPGRAGASRPAPGVASRAPWRCPECGHRFVTRNMWHSCAAIDVASHFVSRPPRLAKLYRAWLAFVRRHGGAIEISVNRTRISFMAETRFSGCIVMSDRVRGSLVLTRAVRAEHFARVKEEAPGLWVHQFDLVTDTKPLDAALAKLVAESYRDYGMRGRLARREPR